MRLRIKSTKLTLQIISWLQIVGGVTGLGLVAYLMLQTGAISGGLLLIFLLGLALFSYSIHSGKRLLTDQDKRTGIILSIINQALLVFQWTLFGYGLTYSSGAEVVLGIQDQEFKFNFAILISGFNISINTDNDFFIKINLVAVFLIFVLADILHELKHKSDDEEIGVQEIQANALRTD